MSDVSATHRHPQSADGCGPHSRPGKLALVSGRSAEGRFLAKERAELAAAIGGAPTSLQIKIIDSLALLALRLHLMDRQALADASFSERNGRQYLAWRSQYERGLHRLAGMKVAKAAPPALADYMASKQPENAL